eukprot:scaffold13643_cov110-Isochrysis_galbana.AAC.1
MSSFPALTARAPARRSSTCSDIRRGPAHALPVGQRPSFAWHETQDRCLYLSAGGILCHAGDRWQGGGPISCQDH